MITDKADSYIHKQGIPYIPDDIRGTCSLPVLQFLWGKSWDDLALRFVYSVKPTLLRVVLHNHCQITDGRLGRVTVHLKEDNRTIDKITQEVDVCGSCGYDLLMEFYKQYGQYL